MSWSNWNGPRICRSGWRVCCAPTSTTSISAIASWATSGRVVFKSPAIQCEGYLLSCGRYIERNPLEAGLVTEPWQYAWSSCRAYASGAADPLLAENSYYLEWGVDDGSRQRRWREFLIQEDPKEQPIRRGLGGG